MSPEDPPTCRAVLWDFGGVLTTSPFEAFARYERERGLPLGFIRGLNATNADTNAWAKLERSEVDIAGFCTLFEAEADAAGGTVRGGEVLALLSGDLRPAMIEALRRCKQAGLRIAMLTNNVTPTDAMADPITGAMPSASGPHAAVLDLFDVIVESSKAGVRKPDPAAYELVIDALVDIDPTEIVYLDDLGINLKPARAMGMRTIKVDDPDTAIAALEAAVGFPLSP